MAKKEIPLNINESQTPFVSADELVQPETPSEDGLNAVFISNLARLVEERFESAERGRRDDEKRWLEAYHNYRGVYNKNIKFKENEKSKVFIKVTKTKVLAAYGQLIDVVFSGSNLPIQIQETIVPDGIAEYAHLNPLQEKTGGPLDAAPDLEGNLDYASAEEGVTEDNVGNFNPYDVGFAGDGNTLAPGAVQSDTDKFLGSLEEEYQNKEGETVVTEGPSRAPENPQIKPAQIAARRMEKLIHDQIEESNGATEIRNAIFESVLLGTGIIKGPFNFNKTVHKWTTSEQGGREYTPEDVRVPRLEFVSAWDFYPDPNSTSMDEAEWAVHRHKYNKSQLRALMKRPYFDKQKISECIKQGYNYQKRSFEDEIKLDNNSSSFTDTERFEVLEYWGVMDAEYARDAGLEIDDSVDDLEEIQVNAWVCQGKIIRLVGNPFKPSRLPYNAVPYEKNPYSFWGVGVPENMEDSQQIMNGHARMAIDNLALAGSLVFDVDEAALVAGQSMDIYPGKIFKRQAGMPGQSIYGLKFPNTAPENMQMFDRFRQIADESTGIPSYSHGNTGVQGMTRTASGMSMLMGAASLNIKTVVKNLDDFLLKPLAVSFYQWNMQFYEGELNVVGDLEIKATGTSSLMQKEVRSQRLTTFLQSVQNPAVAPFVKVSKIIQELAYSLDFDPEEIINSPEEAAIYAEIIGLQNQQSPPGANAQQSPMGEGGGIPGGGAGEGVTGNGDGTIGTGNVPMPGESEFSQADAATT
ncbi:MAG: hypothetical protein HON83_08550 [Candidatus Marinimicrobia bacterium]|jgi:hypothetical protein|nr:hypothetical protein [Candidatus Neomarinimicrobiota bacterium]MBT5235459.1 hypothetical protein [Candidatus Neomarinimicrobiota bacterium]